MRLKKARQHARLTQEELAERAGLDHSAIAKLEGQQKRYLQAHYQTIINIARVLECDPLDVFPVPALRRRGPVQPGA